MRNTESNGKSLETLRSDLPLRLTGERAWRTYIGGSLIDALHGGSSGEDGQFPEEWITSLVSARNAGRETMEEGMSRLAENPSLTLKAVVESDPAAFLGAAHAACCGPSMGVLVKLIDAAERLTVQVHPDRGKARELFQSDYGKTECWHILGGREIKGQKPCVYLGFREGVTRDRWKALFESQDYDGMLSSMHRFEVKPGDTILIEGGIPHAIGAGCFLVEIQEPTDYTIRVERVTPSGLAVADFMCHQGLGFEDMFDCFQYGGFSRKETEDRWFLKPKRLDLPEGGRETVLTGGSVTQLVGKPDTSLFSMNQLIVDRELSVELPHAFSGLYILEGGGEIRAGDERIPMEKGNQFFVPAGTGKMTLVCGTKEPVRAMHFFGPGNGNEKR